MRRYLTFTLLAASLLCGQGKTVETKTGWEAVTIPVKTLTGDSFDRLIRMLGVFDNSARFVGDSQLRTIAVYGPNEVVAQMRRLVEELDKPGSEAAIGRNIEMTLTFLRCSTKQGSAEPGLPADIEPVARQLRAATQYKDIQILDTVPLHLQEGKESWETLQLPGSVRGLTASAIVGIRIRPDSVGRKNQARYVRFGRVDLNFKIPVRSGSSDLTNTQFTYTDVGLNTAGDFSEGQKTVLGKVSGLDDESAIFVVIALKILD